MILDTIFRWIWIALAFCISAFTAVLSLFILGTLWAGGALREFAQTQGDEFIWYGSDAFGTVFFVSAVAPALTALPGIIAILVGELFHIRSGLYYTLAGGASLAAIPFLASTGAPGKLYNLHEEMAFLIMPIGMFAHGLIWGVIVYRINRLMSVIK